VRCVLVLICLYSGKRFNHSCLMPPMGSYFYVRRDGDTATDTA